MIEFTKVWTEKGSEKFGSKLYYFDHRTPMEGFDACKVKDDKGNQLECTKIYYPTKYVILKGTPLEFMQKLKEANVAVALLSDLYAHGITIKQFLEENERRNNITLT